MSRFGSIGLGRRDAADVARCKRIAAIRRFAEARKIAIALDVTNKSQGLAGVVLQLAQKEENRD